MKHNVESLDTAINLLLPSIKRALDNGVYVNRIDSLRMVASEFFINSLDEKYNPGYDKKVAIFICQEASKDLQEHGYFVFGNLDFEVGV